MPLTTAQVMALSPSQVMEYLPQLRQLDLRLYDSEHILRDEALEHPINPDRVNAVRTVLLRERHNVRYIPQQRPVLSGQATVYWMDEDGNQHLLGRSNIVEESPSVGGVFWNTRARESNIHEYARQRYGMHVYPDMPAHVGPRLPDPPPQQPPLEGMENEGYIIKKMRAWEIAYLREESYTDFVEEQPRSKVYNGVKVLEDMRKAKGYTLKEIAELVTPGTLGLHMVDGEPYNLVYRCERIDDPRKKILKGSEWKEVKDVEEVLWAAASLEAYNVLDETGLEFTPSLRVQNWLDEITSLHKLAWGGASPLFDYQKEAVEYIFPRKRAMLSLSPGLGKTLTIATAAGVRQAIEKDIRRVLLVCPASLLYYWKGELAKWASTFVYEPVTEVWHKKIGTVPTDVPNDTIFWAITNPETMVRFADEFKNKFDLMIVDESIMFKHRESIRSQKLNSIARTIDKVWLVTGAPATKYLDDMWHQFHILRNRASSSYWRWAERYCWVEKQIWGDQVVANRKGAEELVKKNYADIYFARNQDQVADIPDWLFEDIDIPMAPKQDAIYKKARKEMKIEIAAFPRNKVIRIHDRMALTLRSLQIASNPMLIGSDNSSGKWSALQDIMEMYPGPYIVWVNFVRTGEVIKDMLSQRYAERVALANGSTGMEDRNTIANGFQDGQYDVLVINNTVGKFGFTLTKGRTSIFLERNFDDSYFQALHRNRRIGTELSPIIVNMRSVTADGKRTIDHVVHDALDYRNGMIKEVTAGDLLEVLDD